MLSGRIDGQSHKLCCESSFEEHGAGNPHAVFCGSWQRVTAANDPVEVWVTGLSTLLIFETNFAQFSKQPQTLRLPSWLLSFGSLDLRKWSVYKFIINAIILIKIIGLNVTK
jgi:hypothetical protein